MMFKMYRYTYRSYFIVFKAWLSQPSLTTGQPERTSMNRTLSGDATMTQTSEANGLKLPITFAAMT